MEGCNGVFSRGMMTRNTIPAEDCVFRLDYRDGYRQAFPMTFNNVGLNEDGFVFDGTGDIQIPLRKNITEGSLFIEFIPSEFDGAYRSIYNAGYHAGAPHGDMAYCDNDSNKIGIYIRNSDGIASHEHMSFTPGVSITVGYTWTGDTVTFYKNGVMIDTASLTGTLSRAVDAYIGKLGYANGIFSMKRFEEYSRALTKQEVLDRYNEVTFNVE
jgi:hypothetical protein